MTKSEALERRLATLSVMKISIDNKLARTEWLVAKRGYSDSDETAEYLSDVSAERILTGEMRGTLSEMAAALSGGGDEKVVVADEKLKNEIDLDALVDRMAAYMETVRRCSSTGERIRILRERKNLTTGELSDLTGISREALRRYQSGKTRAVSAENIEKLARALEVSPSVLAGWDEMPLGRDDEEGGNGDER